MNILFLSLLYHPAVVEETAQASKDGLQNQINNYQWAFVNGLRQGLEPGERLSVLNALPVGIFPLHYRDWRLPNRRLEDGFQEIGSLNLPWFKQRARKQKAQKAMESWLLQSKDNREVMIYSLYLPYLQAAVAMKKKYPDLKVTVIVTDLPNELGISSGRQGLLKRVEYAMGNQRVELCRALDRFVLLTEPMANALPIQGKPYLVMEGLILPWPEKQEKESGEPAFLENETDKQALPAVLYTGTLNRELGIGDLLDAFAAMPDCALWLCGRGDMEEQVAKAAAQHPNIRYFGFVSQEEALALQKKAAILINPRSPQGVYTRYSFPSKTLEYMRSGKPVLCHHLEGIPAAYDEYLVYIPAEGAQGIRQGVHRLLSMPQEERLEQGLRAQAYVLSQKNASAQCGKLLSFLRENP